MVRRLPALLAVITLSASVSACAATAAAPPTDTWVSEHFRDHPLVGRIWDTRTRSFISPRQVEARLAASTFVLLGERHDNPDHHLLQARLLSAMTAQGRRPAVVMEMLDDSQTTALTAWRNGNPTDAASLGPAVEWQKTGWPEWRYYQPVAQAAVSAGLPILTANLARSDVRALGRDGLDALPPDRRAALKLDDSLPPTVTEAQTEAVVEGHCGMLKPDQAGPMVTIQTTRDAIMAKALAVGAALPETDGAVLIAGLGHVRADAGVPVQMGRLGVTGQTTVIAFTEVSENDPTPEAYTAGFQGAVPYDLLWFTPVADISDPCEGMEKHFQPPTAKTD